MRLHEVGLQQLNNLAVYSEVKDFFELILLVVVDAGRLGDLSVTSFYRISYYISRGWSLCCRRPAALPRSSLHQSEFPDCLQALHATSITASNERLMPRCTSPTVQYK